MTRVKGICPISKIHQSGDTNASLSYEPHVYVEEIPASAIRVEIVVESYGDDDKCGWLPDIDVPAALIGKKVEVIIIETEAEEKT